MKSARRLQLASCAVLLMAGIASAAEPCAPFEGGKVDAKILQVMRDAAKEGRLYRVLPEKSRVGFCVRHFPFQEFRGEFTHIVGGLALPAGIDRHGQALLLIHTTTMESNNRALNPLVQGHELMDTKRFPEILFIGRAFQWLGPQHGYIYGDITLHGITRPVVFDISMEALADTGNGHHDHIHLRGTSQINRMKFDMRRHRFLVSETVRLCLSVELVPMNH